jgi:murein L,D-transpeptidase YcbB/YkuD
LGASAQPGASGQAGASAPAAAPPPPVVPAEFVGLSDPVALRFYEQRSWRPAWTPDQADALTRGLGEARRHGLDHVNFAPKTSPGAASVQQDIGLTLTALRYAQALAFGHVDPRTIEKVFTLEPNEVDLAAGLELALEGGKLADWLASLPPSDAEYKALSAAYQGSACQSPAASAPNQGAAAEQASPPDQAAPPAKPPPETAPPPTAPAQNGAAGSSPGQNPPSQNAPIQNAPAQNPPAGSPAPESPSKEAAPSESAPKRAAVPTAERMRQLAANLERRRWLARAPPATRIDVNTAGCFLAYLRPDTDPWAARVVVGKVDHETPSIQASFHRLVANPKWRVPMDIARKEIFPKGSGYLRREHMHVVGGQVVQEQGPHNSLGLVKFDVQDPYAIYLHDTPSKSMFALPDRHKSHGCVRVQDAVGFARRLADQAGKADQFDKALASGKTREVDLNEAIAVRILYHTAYADDAGQVTVIPDVYGWNDKLAAALGLGHDGAAYLGKQPDVDLGP